METPDGPEEKEDAPAAAEQTAPGSPSTRAVAKALATCVHEALVRGEPAEVPGLGTFRVEHQSSQMREKQAGRFSVTPPRDVVAFEPAQS